MDLSVFILAAGLGERLRPIADYIPKPLLPILGKPVLQSILEKVSELPISRIGINLYHKKEAVEHWIKNSAFCKSVQLFPEDPMLGTGGALKNAEAFFKESTFLVHNSDIVSDIDLGKLLEFHRSSSNLVTLAVHHYPKFNNLIIDEKQSFRGIGKANSIPSKGMKLLAFTGIAVYSHEIMSFLQPVLSSIVDAWMKAVKSGYQVGIFDVSGCSWSDIGTPVSYAATVIKELRNNGETVYIHPSLELCRHVEIDGYVVIEEESMLDRGVSLRNCIVLPGSKVEGNSYFENCIIGPQFTIKLKGSELFDLPDEKAPILIGSGGSNRNYYRIKRKGLSAVLMQCSKSDKEFQRHIEYSRFFQKFSIPVPKLIEVHHNRKSALFEDLGDLSLYSWLKCPHLQEEIEGIYRRVIDVLILIHTVAAHHVSECPLLQNRLFDYKHLRWETTYFIERYVEGIKDIKVKNLKDLNDEFYRLAAKVDSFTKTVIHRDFQSQNIMITKGGIPRLVDYQGARIGPPAYDVVSLLWDPYYRLRDDTRERLLEYYIVKIKKSYSLLPSLNAPLSKGGRRGFKKGEGGFTVKGFKEIEFKETLLLCRLQRHMQALGAYGFLSRIKGKKFFLKYVSEGLRLLKEDVSLSKKEYPELYSLVTGLL